MAIVGKYKNLVGIFWTKSPKFSETENELKKDTNSPRYPKNEHPLFSAIFGETLYKTLENIDSLYKLIKISFTQTL
jgi:hypothetical protein